MTERPAPDVCVIMPAWRSADFITTAIASVQAQENVSWELIIVDDASPDNTGTVVQGLANDDPRIKYERLSKNSGPAAARNRAIALSTAPFIAVLDDDDTMHPRRLRTMLDLAEANNADIVIDNMLEVEDTLARPEIGPFLSLPIDSALRSISLEDYLDPRAEARFGASLGYLKPLFRRSSLWARYNETLRNSEDFYLVAELLAHGASMLLSPEPLYSYTRRRGSLSWRLSAAHAEAIVNAHKRFNHRHGQKLSSAERRASNRLLRQRQDMYVFAVIVEALKARRVSTLVTTLFGQPASLPFVTSEIVRIAREKLVARFRLQAS
ncbi:MAG: glycosyltransferase family 2 protein [Pseudomonadota bacterium]